MLTNNLLLIFLFYLIGSLPFALILTKLSGFGDIRNIGSGNVGATNVLRTGNKILAFIVLLLDILKGFIPFLIIHIYFHEFVFFLPAIYLNVAKNNKFVGPCLRVVVHQYLCALCLLLDFCTHSFSLT